MGINNVAELRQHLQWAMSVELSLIQPYLFAMYSIADTDGDPYKLVRSVVTEEMLHAVLDANLLVAVGGDPKFYSREHFREYPMEMPHHTPQLMLHLEPMSAELLQTFIVIEQPKDVDPGDLDDDSDVYHTQGQFYLAIETAIKRLNAESDLFDDPRPDRQMGDPRYYAPVEFDAEDSGGIVLIDSLAAACDAIDIVIHQGEGLHEAHFADPDHLELTHYFKFKNIADGVNPLGDVWPMAHNPKRGDLDPALHDACDLFNAAYCYTLITLDEIYQPQSPGDRDALVGRLYALMSDVMSPVALWLVRRPISPGAAEHAGPTFEFYDFASAADAKDELLELARRADVPGVADTVAQL